MANFFDQFDETTDETTTDTDTAKTGNFFDQYDEKAPAVSTAPASIAPVVEAVPESIDPAVQQEVADRQAMIEMMGVDPYTGEVVSNNPVSMIPGILDINENAAAEFDRLKGIYPQFFNKDFQVETERPWYQFGFGEKPTQRVRGTEDDEVFTYSDGRQQVAPSDSKMVADDSGVEVLVPGYATDEQISQAKLTGVFTDTEELPELSRSMYDSFAATPEGREAAMLLYKTYVAVGETSALGQPTYKGKSIPIPDTLPFTDPGLDFTDNIDNGIMQGAKGLVQVLAAGNDYLNALGNDIANSAIDATEEITGMDIGDFDMTSDTVGDLEKAFPSPPMDSNSLLDSVALEGSSLLVGAGGGVKVGNWLERGLSRISAKLGGVSNAAEASQYLMRYAPKVASTTRVLSTEAGMAAALNPDIETLFVGQNAMLPLAQGIEVDPQDPQYKQIMSKKANILADALFGARVIQTGVEGGVAATKIVYLFSGAGTITGLLSKNSRQEAFVNNTLRQLAVAAEPGASPERASQIQKEIIQYIQDNKDVIMEVDDKNVEIGLSTLAAVQRAIRNDDTETARRIISAARTLEQGVIGNRNATGELATVQGRPSQSLVDVTKDIAENRGGADAVSETGDILREEANAPIIDAQRGVAAAEADATNFSARIAEEVRNDPFFGSKIQKLNTVDGVSIVLDRNSSMDRIVTSLRKANTEMSQKKDELFGKIKGGRLNLRNAEGQQFGEALYERLSVLNKQFLDAGNPKKPGNSQIGDLLAVVNELDKSDAIKFLSNKVTFEDLYTSVRPNLVDTLSRLERDGSFEASSALQDLLQLKSLIDDDAIEYLNDTGQIKKIASAEEAMDYYKNEFSQYWRDGGVLQELDRVNNSSAGRLNLPGPLDATRQQVEGALTDANRLQGSNMIDTLMLPDAGGSVDDVVDYVIADAVVALDTQAGKALNEVDFTAVRQKLMERASLLDGNPATSPAADQIRSFLRTITQMQNISPELAARIDTARARLVEAEDQLKSSALNRFFAGNTGQALPNTQAVLDKLFADTQSLGTVQGEPAGQLVDILNKINEIPDPAFREATHKGLQASFSNFLRERFLIATREMPDQRGISAAKIEQELGGVTNFLDKARLIYADQPAIPEVFETYLELLGIQANTRKATSGAGNSITADKTEAIAAANKMVTLTFGALSRLGARVRASATGFINDKINPEDSIRIAEELLSRPDEFLEIARKVVPDSTKGMTEEQMDLMYAWVLRSGIYSEEDENSQQDFMMALIDAAAKVEETAVQGKSRIDDQMQRFLGYQ
jgi:hypothetical protein